MDQEVRQRLVRLRQWAEADFVVAVVLISAAVAILYGFLPLFSRRTHTALPSELTSALVWLAQWQAIFWALVGLAVAIIVYESANALYRYIRYGEYPDFF